MNKLDKEFKDIVNNLHQDRNFGAILDLFEGFLEENNYRGYAIENESLDFISLYLTDISLDRNISDREINKRALLIARKILRDEPEKMFILKDEKKGASKPKKDVQLPLEIALANLVISPHILTTFASDDNATEITFDMDDNDNKDDSNKESNLSFDSQNLMAPNWESHIARAPTGLDQYVNEELALKQAIEASRSYANNDDEEMIRLAIQASLEDKKDKDDDKRKASRSSALPPRRSFVKPPRSKNKNDEKTVVNNDRKRTFSAT
jgi:hypothetical protein